MKKNNLIFPLLLSFFLFFFPFDFSLSDVSKKKDTFDKKEMVDKAKIYFADLSEGIGIIIERSFNDFGQPSAYIEGQEFSGAFFGGLRYGKGKIYFKGKITETNLMERKSINPIKKVNESFDLILKPFEIKTYRCTL